MQGVVEGKMREFTDLVVGWVGKIGKPAGENGMEAELMERLGAVIYGELQFRIH